SNGSEIFCLQGHTAPVRDLAISPDGERLASISRPDAAGGRNLAGEVVIWDMRKGQKVLTLAGRAEPDRHSELANVTFSPDGTRVATSEGRIVRIWNIASGEEILGLPSIGSVAMCISFNRDGSRLAAASQDGSVTVWDATTGETRLTMTGHTSAVWGM